MSEPDRYPLLRKDYIRLDETSVTYLSDEASQFYTALFVQHGLMNPTDALPSTRSGFEALAWPVLDSQAEQIVNELGRSRPNAEERAATRWSGSKLLRMPSK